MNLVKHLLDTGLHRDHPTRSRHLGDFKTAIGRDLRNWVAQIGQVRHILESRIRIISAGDLACAFHQMPYCGATAQCVPIICRPAEFVDERRQKQRRVGHPPCHNHIGTLFKRIDDRERADICVCRHDAVVGGRKQRVLVLQTRLAGAQVIKHVVAGYGGNL